MRSEILGAALGSACIVLTVSWQAIAQNQLAQGPTDDTEYAIEEIVVTATKRETPLLYTPLAITALSGKYLEDIGASQFEDYFSKVPGLNAIDEGAGRKRYVVRGVNIIDGVGSQATVAQYLDEVPITNSFAKQPDPILIDIERVEVLRGPQGTLFGARSMAGTVRTITRKPVFNEVQGSLSGTLSSTKFGGESSTVNGVANIPLVDDKLALRMVAFYNDEAGYIDNEFPGGVFIPMFIPPGAPVPPPLVLDPVQENNINSVKRYGGRAAVRWNPTDRLTFDFMTMAQLGNVDGIPFYQVQATGDESEGLILPVPLANGNSSDEDAFTASLTVNYELNWGTFTWVSSFYDRNTFGEAVAGSGGISGPNGPGSTRTSGASTDNITLEARFASDIDGPLQWIVGGYHFDQSRKGEVRNFIGFEQQVLDNATFTELSDETAVFGELSYELSPGFTLTTGVRYSDFHSEFQRFFIIPPPFSPIQPGLDPNVPMYDEGSTTLKFLASYEVSDDAFVYAQAGEGFRAGGYNPGFTPGFSTFEQEFESDSLWSYELGARSSFLDGRVYLDSAIFFIDWNNIQINNFAPSPGGGPMRVRFNDNASSAEISGIEVAATLRPTRGLDVDLAFSHLFKAELSADFPLSAGDIEAKAGDPLPNNSKTSFNVGVQYSRPVGRDVEAFGRLDWRYAGSQTTGFRPLNGDGSINNDFNAFDDYSIFNVRAGISLNRSRISIFANNVTDARPVINQRNFFPEPFTSRVTVRPRTIGMSFDQRF